MLLSVARRHTRTQSTNERLSIEHRMAHTYIRTPAHRYMYVILVPLHKCSVWPRFYFQCAPLASQYWRELETQSKIALYFILYIWWCISRLVKWCREWLGVWWWRTTCASVNGTARGWKIGNIGGETGLCVWWKNEVAPRIHSQRGLIRVDGYRHTHTEAQAGGK